MGTLRKLAMLCLLVGPGSFSTVALAGEVSGQVRGYWIDRQTADSGPLASANRLQPGTAATAASAATAQLELRSAWTVDQVTLHAAATMQVHHTQGANTDTQSWFNEAYASGSALGWQWSAGKKVVSWDVGFGFRPNDMVQQEARRALASGSLIGHPLLMAEHFDADTAWSLLWVNPGETPSALGDKEAALAARVYRRSGAVDWHGFARYAERTGTSVGAAASWVASDAVEIHASVRGYQHIDSSSSRNPSAAGNSLATSNPWGSTLAGAGQQILVGGTWTHESQISLLLEAWHDSAALSDDQWSAWTQRNQSLPAWLTRGVPAAAVAGNLAWQGNAFGVASNLRQDNVFARLSWQHERWVTALDMLYTPADQGLITTASVAWSGDAIKLEGGLRSHSGPEAAVVRQLPVQTQAYMVATWAF